MFTKLHYLYRAFRYRWHIDPAEIRFVCDSLQSGQVAVDIGCHKGAYTFWMRRRVGPSGAVYAFEPQPNQVAYLRNVFSAMNYDNVEIVPMALSDHCGASPLFLPVGLGKTHAASLEAIHERRGTNTAGYQPPVDTLSIAPQSIAVDVTTLDDFFATKSLGPNFLKIDVEGHELAVLQGGLKTLQNYRPTLLIECEARHRPDQTVTPVLNLLTSLGYSGTFFHKQVRRPLAEFDPAVHQKLDVPDPVFLPREYVNNFAFVPGR